MAKQTILDNDAVTLWYHADKKIIHHQFKQFAFGEKFRSMMEAGYDVLKKNGATKWLSDDRKNSALKSEDGEWGETNWAPRMIQAGWKFWAIVLPEKVVGKMNMKQFIENNSKRGVTVQVFSDPDEAFRWLEKQ